MGAQYICVTPLDWYQKTLLLLIWLCIKWLHNGFRTRTGGWQFWLLPCHCHILSIPLELGRGISAETCGLDGLFTPFIMYIPCIIVSFLVSKINSFQKTYIQKVGVAMLVYWMIWYCDCFLSGFKCKFSSLVQYYLYLNMDISTIWHCTLVSSTPSQSIGLFFGCAMFWCWVSLGARVTISLR